MKYRVQQWNFPWARMVTMELPYQLSARGELPDHPSYRAGDLLLPQYGEAVLVVVVYVDSGWSVSYTFSPQEKEQLSQLLDALELAVIERIMSGTARQLPMPSSRLSSRRRALALMDWLANGPAPLQAVCHSAKLSEAEIATLSRNDYWRLEGEVDCKKSPSYRLVSEFARKVNNQVPGYKSKKAVARRLLQHWEGTVIPSLYQHAPPLPPVERRVKRILDNLGIIRGWARDAIMRDPNGSLEYALAWRTLERAGLLGVISNFHYKQAFVAAEQFLREARSHTVTYLPESGYLLSMGWGQQYANTLTVARGPALRVLGSIKIDRRKKHPVAEALLKLGVVRPHKYKGVLVQAQEHPAFELRRRRGFSDGTVLYERRLLGSVVDYVAICGRSIRRGPGPRHVLGS